MKQDIACNNCALRYRAHPADMDGPAEYVKKVKGTALKDYRCDACGKDIPQVSECVAVSVYTERTPYFGWENQYITFTRLP